jgi:AcrR family transcriptional regulator
VPYWHFPDKVALVKAVFDDLVWPFDIGPELAVYRQSEQPLLLLREVLWLKLLDFCATSGSGAAWKWCCAIAARRCLPDITKHRGADGVGRLVGSSSTLRRLQQAPIRRRMVMFFCGMASG